MVGGGDSFSLAANCIFYVTRTFICASSVQQGILNDSRHVLGI